MHHETSLKFNKQFKQNAKQQSVVTRGKKGRGREVVEEMAVPES